MLEWKAHDDGSFDVITDTVRVEGCWPALDDAPLHPVRVEVDARRVTYHLPDGTVELTFGRDEDGLTLGARLEGFPVAPHRVEPLWGGPPERGRPAVPAGARIRRAQWIRAIGRAERALVVRQPHGHRADGAG